MGGGASQEGGAWLWIGKALGAWLEDLTNQRWAKACERWASQGRRQTWEPYIKSWAGGGKGVA